MTTINADLSLDLIGLNSPYPNSSSWGNTVSITFLEYVPGYYPPGYYFGFLGEGNDGAIHPLSETGLFSTFTNSQRDIVRLLANGDSRFLGFAQFTAASVNELLDDGTSPTEITFGHLNYQPSAEFIEFIPTGHNPSAVTLSVGSQPDILWSYDTLGIPSIEAAGDIWIFQGGDNAATYIHELGHALGLHHSHNDLFPSISRGPYDSAKYTVMSYNNHPGEGNETSEWQIFDIASLQYLYGVGAHNILDNVYVDFSYSDGTDRILSIWDSGGTDTISSQNYSNNSYIDLRPGYFSSIGYDAFLQNTSVGFEPGSISKYHVDLGTDGSLGRENVSIAFGAYIENAIGSVTNDVMIGNALSNKLEGHSGDDLLFGDGFGIQNADSVLLALGREQTGLYFSGSATDADYRQIEQNIGASAVGVTALNFVLDYSLQADLLDGGEGDDLIVGTRGKDHIIGGDGADILLGGHEDDHITGGDGDDILFGQEGSDTLEGDAGDDQIDGGGGIDVIVGEAGNDLLRGGEGRDILSGGEGVDLIEGGSGNDRLTGGKGDDNGFGAIAGGLFGGLDDDLLISELNDGDDDIDGGLNGTDLPLGDGTDTVVYKYYHGNSTVSITSTPFIGNQKPSDFGLTIDGARDANNVAGSFEDTSDVLTSIERAAVEAGDGGDTLVIDDDSDVSYIEYIDLGGQGATFSAYDKLDVSALSTNVTVDLRNASDQVLYVNDGAFSGSELRLRNAENVEGTEYNDVLYGTNAAQGGQLRGNGGNDQLISGAGASVLEGGDGNDLLVAGGVASHLFGGSGTDRFLVGANATIEDAEQRQGEETYYAGIRLTGGMKQWWMEGNAAYYAPFTSLSAAFPVIGSELITTAAIMIDSVTLKFVQYSLLSDGTLAMMFGWGQGGIAYLENYDIDFNSGVGSAGISVFQVEVARQKWASQQNIDKYVNLALYSGFGHGLPGYDPLVLDLNGDGFDLVAETVSSTYFEFDTDGFGEHAGWVRGTDGFLVRDANANGKIDNVTEMFGNETTGGFDMLAGYDANLDGVINASDGTFASLSVWQDYNQDGVTDAGELKSLAELGIVSISLTHSAPTNPTVIGGNTISQLGSFTRADGSTGGVADVLLGLNETNSKWLGDNSVSSAAEALPQLSGFGELKDLRVAMTADATLAGLVEDYVALDTTDLSLLEDGAEAILYRWAGIDGVTPQALGSDGFDTRKLAFLEKYTGYELMPRDVLGAIELDNLDEVEALWADQLTRLTLRLVVQGPLADTFDGITYNAERDLLVASTPTALGDLLKGLLEDLPSDPTAASTQWKNWAPLLGALTESMVRFDANIVRGDYVFVQLVAAMDGVTQPLTLAQLSSALGIANVQIGTTGNETLARSGSGTAILYSNGGDDQLNGGSGQDVYVFGRQIGHATITDIEAREAGDRIRFAFLNPGDVSMARSGADLLITVTASGETVRVTGQFADVTPGGADLLLSSNKGVEDIQFADGTVMEIPAIMIAVGTGTDGDDHLIGSMHSDALTGGKGNDLLQGGDDADLYVVNAGDGQDVIEDIQTTPLLRSADMLIFGDDIAPDDLVVTRVGEGGNDLLFTIGTSGQSVLIRNQFTYTSLGYTAPLALNSRIEAFGFRDYGDSWSYNDIQQKLITQSITAGADMTRGFGDDDTFKASAGNDILIGMDGADTYNWGKGSGNDTIDEQAAFIDVEVGLGGISLTTRADTVQFSQGVTLADLKFSRESSAPDLTITIISTGEKLTVKNQFDGIQTGVLGAQWFNRVEWFQLADGTRISWQEVEALVTTGGVGDDQLYGDIVIDTMKGGVGNDFLSGGGAGDTYIFNSGDGHDTLQDNNWSFLGEGFVTVDGSPDILQFGSGITAADISFARNGKDVDLIIGTTGDRVTLKGQDDYIYTGIFGNLSANRIEEIRFADGTVWTWQQLNRNMIAAATTAGDDITLGTSTEDVFASSAGNDIIDGGDGSDIYAFDRGADQDIIRDHVDHIFNGEDDRLNFGAGITLADLAFSREADDLIITIIDTGDTVRIEEQFRWDAWYVWHDIETFGFADGSTITNAAVQQILLAGTAGNDTLVGFSGDDLLDGGAGDDQLIGGDGSDTYVFGRGYGNDTIQEQVGYILRGDDDKLTFTAGITEQDLTFVRDGDDLVITIIDTTESIRIHGQFASAAGYLWQDIETFAFADGSSLSDADVRAKIVIGGSGNDTLVGFVGSDTLDGKAGDDLLYGGDGNDIYIFGRGYGHDAIYEQTDYIFNGDYDQLTFLPDITLADLGFARDGNDLVITILDSGDSIRVDRQWEWQSDFYTWRDIEIFNFADGSSVTKAEVQQILLTGGDSGDNLTGFTTDDTLIGGKGDDFLSGGMGADTYIYAVGDGNDVLSDYVFYSGSAGDKILLGAGISAAMVTVEASAIDPSDMVLSFDGLPGSITIKKQILGGIEWGIELVEFADGTFWTAQDLAYHLNASSGTPGDDIIAGTTLNDSLYGGPGNDTISGQAGDDLLSGEGGDDILDGGAGNNRLEGGSGNDLLLEGSGNDTYVWNLGDGEDLIRGGGYWDGFNAIAFGTGIAAADIILAKTSDGRGVIFTVDGQTGSITLETQLVLGASEGIDEVRFADGTVWNRTEIQQKIAGAQSTELNDTITGTNGSDFLFGAGGNDSIDARNGDDRLIGGVGNDLLHESEGNDTYIWNLGDGDDIIRGGGWWDGLNTIEFGTGIAATDLVYSYSGTNGSDLRISVAGQSGSITIEGQMSGYAGERMDQIRFADGSLLTRSDWLSAALVQLATSDNDMIWGSAENNEIVAGGGNDTIDARDGADRIAGGTGNDLLMEGSGDDTYIWNVGDGDEIIRGGGYWDGFNTLEFGAGVTASDLVYAYAGTNGSDLKISVLGQSGSITIEGQMSGYSGEHVDQVRFADGTALTRSAFLSAAFAQFATAGNDSIWGTAEDNVVTGNAGNDMLDPRDGNDRLVGGTGNDLLYESGGDDAYVWNLGDGHDVIRGGGYWDGFNTLEFGAGISLSDLRFARSGNGWGDLILRIDGQPGSIMVEGYFAGYAGERIDQLSFVDGQTVALASILSTLSATDIPYVGSEGNDNLSPPASFGVIDAGAGGDQLTLSAAGGGTIIFRAGDGDDILENNGADYTRNDNLHLIDTTSDDVELQKSGNELQVTIISTGATFTARQQFSGSGEAFGISAITFGDGESWDRTTLLEHTVIMGTAAGDSLSLPSNFYHVRAGSGDDLLSVQGSGSGTFEFAEGDGNDMLSNNPGSTYIRDDTLLLTDSLLNDVSLAKDGAALIVTINSTGDTFTASSHFMANGSGGIGDYGFNQIRFADGTILSRSQIAALATANLPPSGLDLTIDMAMPSALVGSASQLSTDTYRLTPAQNQQNGAIWGDVDLSGNATWVTKIYFGGSDGGADGVAFGFQNAGGSVLGTSGVLTATSLGIRFDTWTNPGIEPSSDFSQIVLNGNISATSSQFDSFHLQSNIEDGLWHDVIFQWKADTSTLSYSFDGVSMGGIAYDAVDLLFGGDSTVKFGFGAFTGGLSNDQQVQLISLEQQVSGFTVQENSASGMLVGYLNGRDPNPGDLFHYAIVDGEGEEIADSWFEIANGNELRIKSGSTIDYEQETTHDLLVRVTDPSGASKVQTVSINIADQSGFTITGTSGNDTLRGGGEVDTIDGMGGADLIIGQGSADTLSGGDGADFIFGDGPRAVGPNLILNGSFEDLGTTGAWYSWGGLSNDIPSWTRASAGRHIFGYNSYTTDGYWWMSMEDEGSNADISQNFNNLSPGENYILQFDASDRGFGSTAGMSVYWNGVLLDNPSINATMSTFTYVVSAQSASNSLRFAGTGVRDNNSAALDNVRLFSTSESGVGDDILLGGNGDDKLYGGDGSDRLTGGSGNDNLAGDGGTDIAVFTGEQNGYSLSTANGMVIVTDLQPMVDGDDGTDTLKGIEIAEFKNGVQFSLAAPIVLDLDGNGISFLGKASSTAYFDWDGDGVRDQTGWIAEGDAFLAFDRNGDGVILGSDELSFINDKPSAKSDLDGLSAFDQNGDGLFSSADERFGDFRIWEDRNGDGISAPDELRTLEQAGIASVSLGGKAMDARWGWDENIVLNTGNFTWSNGGTGAFADAALNYSADSALLDTAVPGADASRLIEAITAFGNGVASDEMIHHSFAYDAQISLIPDRRIAGQ